jgi:hypothetical protein
MTKTAAQVGVEWITRGEAGRRLGVSAMAVTKFCRASMPHRISDGNVCWPAALYWSDWYRAPRRSGSWSARHSGYCEADERIEDAARELRRPMSEAWWRIEHAQQSKLVELRRVTLRAEAGCNPVGYARSVFGSTGEGGGTQAPRAPSAGLSDGARCGHFAGAGAGGGCGSLFSRITV